MYCLQWLIPVLLLPKPINPDFIHYAFLILHLISFFLEKKPCTICSLIFFTAIGLICYSCWDSCILWSCSSSSLPASSSNTLTTSQSHSSQSQSSGESS